MELFPAVLIGGPPNSGKSVLTYSLSQSLRKRGVAHYVLRAAPDGEGDWFHEAEPRLTRQLRIKGTFDERWVDRIVQDIRRRHLPLLVDVGGMPTPEQERIFSVVTHAVLLIRDPAARPAWQERVRRYGLHLIADLDSRLEGSSEVLEETPVLRGVITGLERGRIAEGPVFEALAERIAALFRYDPEELRRYHLAMAPDVDWVIDLDELARMLEVRREGEAPRWAPEDLPRTLDFLPEGKPLALYGRGPAWLYAALAVHALPAPFFQFDVRLGWVEPPRLHPGTEHRLAPASALGFLVESSGNRWRLQVTMAHPYLEREEVDGLVIPAIPAEASLIIDGKLPLWLWTALARAYAGVRVLAVFEPRSSEAIVVASRDPAYPVGTRWPVESAGAQPA
ncbi:CRISPR-associated protein Csx3 [Thermoflexus sp.]|uniref:CRISPR-associated protein Csx3 n=1 Tax=Thermoflexus sp. TaxID=1969742 RepID=UPI0017592BA4|nr:CRISPR-associated protein Csx3 [Thermoflexus sp.]